MERNICIDAKSSDLCLNKRGLMPGLRGKGFFSRYVEGFSDQICDASAFLITARSRRDYLCVALP